MNDPASIAAMVDALDTPTAMDVAARLPAGAAAEEVLNKLVDEAEARIMADLSRAVRTTRALVEVAQARGSEAVRARTRRVHGQALTYANKFAEAIATLDDALTHADAARDVVEGGRIRLAMLHVYARQTRFDDAVRCGTQALAAFEQAGVRVMTGRAQNNLGILERMRGRPASAIGHFEHAAAALADQPPLLAHVENNLAEAYLDLDQFARAERAFRSALASFRAAGAHRHAGIVLGNLADLTSRQGRLREALALFEEARRALGDAAAPGDAARLAIEHAEVLDTLGEPERAADALREALPVLESHAMAAESARANLALGRTLARLNDPTSGERLLASARAFETLGNSAGRARALSLIAESASARGDDDRALALLGEARDAVRDRPAALAGIDLLAANVLIRAGRAPEAVPLADAAAAEADRLGVAPLASDLLHAAGLGVLAQGRPAEAAARLRGAVQRAERSRGSLQTSRFRSAFLGDRAALWEDCAAAVLDAGAPGCLDEAFALTESVRSRSLLDVLAGGQGESRASEGCEGSLVAELASLQSELESLYARTHDHTDATPEARARTLAEIRAREAKADAIVIRLGSTASFGGQFAAPLTLEQVAAGIPDDGALVSFMIERGRVSAFVVRRGAARVHRRFAAVDDLRERLAGLMFQVGRALARGLPGGARGARLAGDADAELLALSDLLLTPLAPALADAERLAIAPTGPLHGVPFPALRLGPRRLLDVRELGIVPSASVLARLPRQGGGPALVVGVGDPAAPRADAEAHEVARVMPDATVLTGLGATRAAFRAMTRGKGHVHFAGHARFIPTNPGASGLKLIDGWLTASDLAGLDLRGASVMLSGCDTGRAATAGGDEQVGLARAVLSAGAASVTTTLWPVHDESTSALMAGAYNTMYGEDGGPRRAPAKVIGRCLRTAQRDLLNQGAHAAAWAPFLTVCSPWAD